MNRSQVSFHNRTVSPEYWSKNGSLKSLDYLLDPRLCVLELFTYLASLHRTTAEEWMAIVEKQILEKEPRKQGAQNSMAAALEYEREKREKEGKPVLDFKNMSQEAISIAQEVHAPLSLPPPPFPLLLAVSHSRTESPTGRCARALKLRQLARLHQRDILPEHAVVFFRGKRRNLRKAW
jgi:hypothetical protein